MYYTSGRISIFFITVFAFFTAQSALFATKEAPEPVIIPANTPAPGCSESTKKKEQGSWWDTLISYGKKVIHGGAAHGYFLYNAYRSFTYLGRTHAYKKITEKPIVDTINTIFQKNGLTTNKVKLLWFPDDTETARASDCTLYLNRDFFGPIFDSSIQPYFNTNNPPTCPQNAGAFLANNIDRLAGDGILNPKTEKQLITFPDHSLREFVISHEAQHIKQKDQHKKILARCAIPLITECGFKAYNWFAGKLFKKIKKSINPSGRLATITNYIEKTHNWIATSCITKFAINWLLLYSHYRYQEKQADLQAVKALGKADGALELFRRARTAEGDEYKGILGTIKWLLQSEHPTAEQRFDYVTKYAQENGLGV